VYVDSGIYRKVWRL